MASTKAAVALENGLVLVAAAGDDTGASQNLPTGYGAQLNLKLTNGAAGPTLPAEIQIQVSSDNAEWYDYGGALVGGVANNGVYSWSVHIPMTVQYFRTVQGSNTGQNVTCDIDYTHVTAVQ